MGSLKISYENRRLFTQWLGGAAWDREQRTESAAWGFRVNADHGVKRLMSTVTKKYADMSLH
jgi:hypothetical protein